MELPKFLIADNSKLEDDLFIVHTEYPRFILNVSNDEEIIKFKIWEINLI